MIPPLHGIVTLNFSNVYVIAGIVSIVSIQDDAALQYNSQYFTLTRSLHVLNHLRNRRWKIKSSFSWGVLDPKWCLFPKGELCFLLLFLFYKFNAFAIMHSFLFWSNFLTNDVFESVDKKYDAWSRPCVPNQAQSLLYFEELLGVNCDVGVLLLSCQSDSRRTPWLCGLDMELLFLMDSYFPPPN